MAVFAQLAGATGAQLERFWLSPGASRPTFPGLPASLDQFQVLHVSCRKPHGGIRDGLAHAHRILNDAGQARPNLLILSGDRIYADDVASVLTPRIRRVAADLVNVDESGVFGPAAPIAGRPAPCDAAGLTTDAGKDHLFGLAEFYAMYLLTWSEVLWPANLPTFSRPRPSWGTPIADRRRTQPAVGR